MIAGRGAAEQRAADRLGHADRGPDARRRRRHVGRSGADHVHYAWSRCDATGAACAAIAGATAKTYVLAAADVDKTLRLAVTAKNALGSQTQTSAPTR